MENLTINVRSVDVKHFYALLVEYRDNPSIIKQFVESKHEDTATPSLYQSVANDCTCGECYYRFARNDRLPWKNISPGKYVNSKHGFVTIPDNCALYDRELSGYVYASKTVLRARPGRARSGSKRRREEETQPTVPDVQPAVVVEMEDKLDSDSESDSSVDSGKETKRVLFKVEGKHKIMTPDQARVAKTYRIMKEGVAIKEREYNTYMAKCSKWRNDTNRKEMEDNFDIWMNGTRDPVEYRGVKYWKKDRDSWREKYRKSFGSDPYDYMKVCDLKDALEFQRNAFINATENAENAGLDVNEL